MMIREKMKTDEKTKGRKKIDELILFPGSVDEYKRFRGYDIEIVDTGGSEKYLHYMPGWFAGDLTERLMNEKGVEALVNLAMDNKGYSFGLPVRRKDLGSLLIMAEEKNMTPRLIPEVIKNERISNKIPDYNLGDSDFRGNDKRDEVYSEKISEDTNLRQTVN